ncbi:unnamed protein product, partial [Iphiclides podalirius]
MVSGRLQFVYQLPVIRRWGSGVVGGVGGKAGCWWLAAPTFTSRHSARSLASSRRVPNDVFNSRFALFTTYLCIYLLPIAPKWTVKISIK